MLLGLFRKKSSRDEFIKNKIIIFIAFLFERTVYPPSQNEPSHKWLMLLVKMNIKLTLWKRMFSVGETNKLRDEQILKQSIEVICT